VRHLLRKHLSFFVAVTTAGIVLRVVFVVFFPQVMNDSYVYGDIARNWLVHGVYGLSGTGGVSPTFIRLPGYPAFLAFVFAVFGVEHYRAVLILQIFVDLGTCFLCASIAFRLVGPRAAKIAFLLAALCPFLANYSAAALTETLEIFFTALAFDLALRGLENSRLTTWAGCGMACACATLLRPDGAMLPFVIVVYLLWGVVIAKPEVYRASLFGAAVLVALIPLLALAPWAARNWRVFHTFQPLAPRYANEEGEFVPMGFNQWTKTWMVDYASVEEVYWQVPGQPIDPAKLPSRAFDNPQQKAQTLAVIAAYNQTLVIAPALDSQFESLAAERIRTHPVRYYFTLPVLRIADMWLRPRTEMLPPDTRWWEFNDDLRWSVLAVGLGVIGTFYAGAGLVGWLRHRGLPWSGLLLSFVILRSAFLGTLENPEPRYTLEIYPIVFVFAAGAFLASRAKKAELD
jgi:4-amino-4-deoxy-L-arabinose transferase-like glycosyltransferase